MNQSANPDPESVAANTPLFEDNSEDTAIYSTPTAVETDFQADMYCEMIVNLQTEKERLAKLLQQRTAKLTADIEAINKRIGWFRLMLENYMVGLNNANPKKKSHKLAAGELSIRAGSDVVIIAPDFKADAEIAQAYPDFIRENITYSVDKAAIKKAIKETGECPPWASLERNPDTVKVKVEMTDGREIEIN